MAAADPVAAAAQACAATPDQNPYLCVRDAVMPGFGVDADLPWYTRALIANVVFYLLIAVLSVVVMAGKLRDPKTRWLYHLLDSPRGRVLQVNATLVSAFWILVFACVVTANLIIGIKIGPNLSVAQACIATVFYLAILMAVGVHCHALAVAAWLSADSRLPGISRLPGWAVSAFFPAASVCAVAAEGATFGIAEASLHAALDDIAVARDALNAAASSWAPGQAFVAPAAVGPALAAAGGRLTSFTSQLRRSCIVFCPLHGLFFVLFLILAVQHIATLRRHVARCRSLASASQGSYGSHGGGKVPSSTPSSNSGSIADVQALVRTWRSLLAELAALAVGAGATFAVHLLSYYYPMQFAASHEIFAKMWVPIYFVLAAAFLPLVVLHALRVWAPVFAPRLARMRAPKELGRRDDTYDLHIALARVSSAGSFTSESSEGSITKLAASASFRQMKPVDIELNGEKLSTTGGGGGDELSVVVDRFTHTDQPSTVDLQPGRF